MQRYKVTISYDGTNYVGFQRQKNGNSIQAEIEKALKKMSKGHVIPIIASGRTDSGVHALGQVIHFDYPQILQENHLKKALNSLLPLDIRVVLVDLVSKQFHARYHTMSKQYQYRVNIDEVQSPFNKNYALHHRFKLNLEHMQRALDDIIGTHDFTSFCSLKSDKENKVRTITRADIYSDSQHNEIIFTFEGDGFLYNMVRIIVGTTLQIGNGLKPLNELERLIAVKNRHEAGPTAPPHGLYLVNVTYKPESQWFQTYEENKGIGDV